MGILRSCKLISSNGYVKVQNKVNINLPQLLCIFVSAAQNGEFERFIGFCIDCYYSVHVIRGRQPVESSILTAPAPS